MNKKEFIKLLEQKLKILDENELKDIINEYKDTIDEKVKHGKREEDAVKDFGDIDELSKEILKAYKINPKYDTEEEKIAVKEVIGDFESWVKRSSKTLADFSKGVYNDFKKSNLTIELIFEILIKIIILLVLLAFLRLPFELINFLGESILDIAFYPLDEVLEFIWEIIIFLLYFVCSILISIAMFKDYFNNIENGKKEPKKIKKEKIEIKKEVKEEKIIKEVKREKVENKDSFTSIIGKILKAIFQVFIVISFIIPLSLVIIGIVVILVLSIYYLCIGINTVGIVLILVGLFLFFSHITDIFHSIAFKHKRIKFYPFLISLVFVAVGFILTIHMVLNIEYLEVLPNNYFNKNTNEYEFKINKETIIRADEIEYIVDNSIKNNEIKVEVEYYPDFTNIGYYEENTLENYNYIGLYTIGNLKYNSGLNAYNLIIDNLKDNKIYNYSLLFDSNTKVYANELTMNLIKKD